MSWMAAPALRPSWPPRPSRSSTLWTMVPSGINESARLVPGLPSGAVSEPSGRALVISAKSEPVWKRRPGEVGRYWTVGIPLRSLEEVDPAALGQGDVGLLPVGAPPLVPADAADLPELAARPHLLDLHLEEGLDRVTDLDLVGVRVDAEHDLVPLLVHQRPLLGDDRALHDV